MEVDGACAFFTALGGDKDNAVCSTGTVDGGGAGVLHHLDGLDVVGVDVGHGALCTVNDYQRGAGTVDAGTAAEDDCGFGSRVTGGLTYGKTCHGACKRSRRLVVYTGSDGLILDR